MDQFDAIIVGAGQAASPLAGRLSAAGHSVVVIERDKLGGTCVNYGCIPTKALVANAKAIHQARRGADFGFHAGEITVDMAAIHQRMKRIAGESNQGVTAWLDGMENVTVIRGDARFVAPRTVAVGDRELSAERVFINVGGHPRLPDIEGIDEVDVLTNEGMLELTELPRHLCVIGGSYIGLEFGQMFRRFGSEVTIVEVGDRLIRREDADVSAAVHDILTSEGLSVRTNSNCLRMRNDGADVVIETDCGSPPIRASHVLCATGRTPNTSELGLEHAGVEVNDRGFITVDEQLRTSADNVWAMGDCNGRGAFTHTAWNDYEIVAANLLDDDPRRLSDRIMCYGLFIDPPLGRVGMTEAQARKSGRNLLIGKRPMSRVGRAREMSETAGFIKIVVDADTEEILGASILGVTGDEAIHCILDVMYAGASYKTIARAVHIHPTVSELLPTVLQELKLA